MSRKGLFITLEGPEGSGKSSQGRWLVRWLRNLGYSVIFLHDPGSTRLGRGLRRVLLHSKGNLATLTEALLFIGARVALVEEKILPALAKGKIVVCDRYHDSTLAYQGYGGNLDVSWLDQLGRRALHNVMPSLTILLDVPTKVGFSRIKHSYDRMESKTRIFHRRVRLGFRRLAASELKRFAIVDASFPSGIVRNQIRAVVMSRLGSLLSLMYIVFCSGGSLGL